MKKLSLITISIISFYSSAQCINNPASASSSNLTYSYVGCAFQSYGCAPIDPTLWFSGNGMSVTISFTNSQNYPSFRVWGMNTDDVASVEVNNINYPLNVNSAYISPKVVCGLSPGPNGILFSAGNVVGSNSPSQGNYSYSDVQLNTTNVNFIKIKGISGAGWGFAGTLINCPNLVTSSFDFENALSIYPNPTYGEFYIKINENLIGDKVTVYNILGQKVKDFTLDVLITNQNLDKGLYLLEIEKEGNKITKKLLVN